MSIFNAYDYEVLRKLMVLGFELSKYGHICRDGHWLVREKLWELTCVDCRKIFQESKDMPSNVAEPIINLLHLHDIGRK